MSFGANYRDYFQGSPIPQQQPMTAQAMTAQAIAERSLMHLATFDVIDTATNMTATEVAQRQQEKQALLGQQMAAMTRAAMVPGALIYYGNGIVYTIANSVFVTAGPVEETAPPQYQAPEWLSAMHTTIDTLHAKGI